MKCYAVVGGREGNKIYKDWQSCERNVKGVSGAKFKKFTNEEEANKFISATSSNDTSISTSDVVAYVDGSFNSKTGSYGYGLVIVKGDKVLHTSNGSGSNQSMASQRNVVGEILGALHAVAYARENNINDITIAYDYKGIECWVTGEWTANNNLTQSYSKAMRQEIANKLNIKFKKVKAHSGNKFNEQADYLAKQSIGIA